MSSRVALFYYVEIISAPSIAAKVTKMQVVTKGRAARVRSPLKRSCGSVVCRKETLESKLREGHVDWRAENRRSTYEAELAGVGYKLERDEHTRGLVAGRRHSR